MQVIYTFRAKAKYLLYLGILEIYLNLEIAAVTVLNSNSVRFIFIL